MRANREEKVFMEIWKINVKKKVLMTWKMWKLIYFSPSDTSRRQWQTFSTNDYYIFLVSFFHTYEYPIVPAGINLSLPLPNLSRLNHDWVFWNLLRWVEDRTACHRADEQSKRFENCGETYIHVYHFSFITHTMHGVLLLLYRNFNVQKRSSACHLVRPTNFCRYWNWISIWNLYSLIL